MEMTNCRSISELYFQNISTLNCFSKLMRRNWAGHLEHSIKSVFDIGHEIYVVSPCLFLPVAGGVSGQSLDSKSTVLQELPEAQLSSER